MGGGGIRSQLICDELVRETGGDVMTTKKRKGSVSQDL
jgi:hypothetical protein